MAEKRYRFSIALLKIPPTKARTEGKLGQYGNCLSHNISAAEIKAVKTVPILPEGKAYIGTFRAGQPAWAETLHSLFQVEEPIPDNTSNRAVIFTTINDRVLALLFGYGKAMLDERLVCRDFGRRVALNILSENDISSMTSFSISDAIFLSQTQASDARRSTEFGVDSYSGIVKQIVGKPLSEEYGISVTGSDILSITMSLEGADDLEKKLSLLLGAYSNDAGRQAGLEWIDQLTEIKDSELKDFLNGILVSSMRGDSLDPDISVNSLSAAPPMIIDWENVGLFYLGTKAGAINNCKDDAENPYQPYVDIDSYIKACKDCPNILSKLHRDHLYTIDPSDSEPRQLCVAYKTLVCEIARGKESFVLIDGKWFKVASTLYDEINQYLSSSELEHVNLHFPDCKRIASTGKYEEEGNYNTRVAETSGYTNLDRSHFRITQGPKEIEVCDLFDASRKRFIHVKKDGSSSVLSHLFSQGIVSAQCYSDDQEYREEFNQLVRCDEFDQATKPQADEFCITYAIITKKVDGKSIPSTSHPIDRINMLPFFSRLNLMQRTRQLRRMGYRVQLGFIGTEQ